MLLQTKMDVSQTLTLSGSLGFADCFDQFCLCKLVPFFIHFLGAKPQNFKFPYLEYIENSHIQSIQRIPIFRVYNTSIPTYHSGCRHHTPSVAWEIMPSLSVMITYYCKKYSFNTHTHKHDFVRTSVIAPSPPLFHRLTFGHMHL